MNFDLTRHTLSWTLLLFAGLTLLFWLRSVNAPVELAGMTSLEMPLGRLIDAGMDYLPSMLRKFCIVLIVFLNGLALTKLITRNMMLIERSYMPFILYLVVSCGVYFHEEALPAHIASGLTVYSFSLMIESFRRVIVFRYGFDSALLGGLAVLVYAPAVVFMPVFLAALVLFRKGWREWIVILTGLILPLLICSYIFWGLGEPVGSTFLIFRNTLAERWASHNFLADPLNPFFLLFAGCCALLTAGGMVSFSLNAATMRTRPYKSYLYFFWILLFGLPLMIFPGRSVTDLPLLAIPLAVIIPLFFNRAPGWLSNSSYLILIGSIVLYNLVPLFL